MLLRHSLICFLLILLGCSSKNRNKESLVDNNQYRETETAVYSDLLTEIDLLANTIKSKDSSSTFIFFLETDTLNSIEGDEGDSILLVASYLGSRILDREQFNSSHRNKIILTKTHLSEQQQITEHKKYEEYKKDHRSTPHSYRFSRVLFNSELNAGVLSYSCMYNCSESCRIFIEKSGNTWMLKKKLICSPPS